LFEREAATVDLSTFAPLPRCEELAEHERRSGTKSR
jgi:hypothetical protein